MKKLLATLLIVISLQCFGQLVPKKQSDGGLMLTGLKDVTVLLQVAQSPYTYIYLGGCTNVKVINDAKVQLTSIDINDSRFISFSGIDSFVINKKLTSWSAAYAISVHGKSSDVEFDRVSVRNCGGGLWWKNEHFCDPTLSDWVLSNISYHDAEIKDIYEHGAYIGATEQENTTRGELCNGVMVYYNPSRTSGIKIYNVKVSGTGKNGLMINDCRYVPAEVFNVTIENCGTAGDPAQGQGLALGGYTKAHVKNVTVNKVTTWGISCFGGDTLTMDNCTVTNTGWENILINNKLSTPMYFEACGNIGNISVSSNVKYDKCKILPVEDKPKEQTPTQGHLYSYKVYNSIGQILFSGKTIDITSKINQLKKDMEVQQVLIISYWDNQYRYTQKIIKN